MTDSNTGDPFPFPGSQTGDPLPGQEQYRQEQYRQVPLPAPTQERLFPVPAEPLYDTYNTYPLPAYKVWLHTPGDSDSSVSFTIFGLDETLAFAKILIQNGSTATIELDHDVEEFDDELRQQILGEVDEVEAVGLGLTARCEDPNCGCNKF
jgi:hypothetical protein